MRGNISKTEARWRSHCCSGETVSTTFPECVFLALVIRHTKGIRCTVIYGLPGCTIYFHIFL